MALKESSDTKAAGENTHVMILLGRWTKLAYRYTAGIEKSSHFSKLVQRKLEILAPSCNSQEAL